MKHQLADAPRIERLHYKRLSHFQIQRHLDVMQDLDDNVLLREYVERASEEAFATLVHRHINKVYSVALRHTRNPHHAEEITQAVFVILAKKSRQLSRNVVLSGWLYHTARLTAQTFIRSEIRRTRREEEAYMQTLTNETETDIWPQIAPMLDAAMCDLNATDRNAIVLRFIDGKSMRDVGVALGANEAAARQRVNRAVEKLRSIFTRKGFVLSTAVLTTAISANSVQAAPVALATSISAVAIAKGTAASGSTLTLIKGTLKLMAWTKAKIAIVTTAALALGVGTVVVVNVIKPNVVLLNGQPMTVVEEFDWKDVAQQGQLAGGKVMKMNGKTVLKIVGAYDRHLPLLKIENPPIKAMHYAVIGEMKCENVEGVNIHMWSFFRRLEAGSSDAQYASSMGDIGFGPGAGNRGTSDWRTFFVPLDRTGKTYPESYLPQMDTFVTSRPPTRLEVGIFLKAGVVYLRELKLVQWDENAPN